MISISIPKIQQAMSPTNHNNHPQPTQWSPCFGMFVGKGGIRPSLESGTENPKKGFAVMNLTKEAGR
jgi:hypothetical protein